jgi:hypothetical protein
MEAPVFTFVVLRHNNNNTMETHSYCPSPTLEMVHLLHLKRKWKHLVHIENMVLNATLDKRGLESELVDPTAITAETYQRWLYRDSAGCVSDPDTFPFSHLLIPLFVYVYSFSDGSRCLDWEYEQGAAPVDSASAHFMVLLVDYEERKIQIIDVNYEWGHVLIPKLSNFFRQTSVSHFELNVVDTRGMLEILLQSSANQDKDGLCVPATCWFIEYIFNKSVGRDEALLLGESQRVLLRYSRDCINEVCGGADITWMDLQTSTELQATVYKQFEESTIYE